MNIMNIINLIANCVVAIGTAILAIVGLRGVQSISRWIWRRDECFFGQEAKERYEKIKNKLPVKYPYIWGPCKWEEDQNISYMLEIKAVSYDPQIMGKDWIGIKTSVRYVYKDETTNEIMVRGWRLK